VPGKNYLFRTPGGWRQIEAKIKNEGWPIDDLLPLLALAQHYRIPTRLLDWSDRPLVAAYFAAKGAASKPEGEFLSVWALNLDWIINVGFPGTKPKMSVYVITAPRASNPNLHAQGGVFTTENLIKAEVSENKRVSVKTVDTFVKQRWSELQGPTRPVMAHLKLPVSQGRTLLRLLSQEQVSAATLFPGYQGVAESLSERALWDRNERVNYWLK
jgi:hypothetical protein